jgi:hypothetical protein
MELDHISASAPGRSHGGDPRFMRPALRPIASTALQCIALIAVAILLILVLLPAALVAAGT